MIPRNRNTTLIKFKQAKVIDNRPEIIVRYSSKSQKESSVRYVHSNFQRKLPRTFQLSLLNNSHPFSLQQVPPHNPAQDTSNSAAVPASQAPSPSHPYQSCLYPPGQHQHLLQRQSTGTSPGVPVARDGLCDVCRRICLRRGRLRRDHPGHRRRFRLLRRLKGRCFRCWSGGLWLFRRPVKLGCLRQDVPLCLRMRLDWKWWLVTGKAQRYFI